MYAMTITLSSKIIATNFGISVRLLIVYYKIHLKSTTSRSTITFELNHPTEILFLPKSIEYSAEVCLSTYCSTSVLSVICVQYKKKIVFRRHVSIISNEIHEFLFIYIHTKD